MRELFKRLWSLFFGEEEVDLGSPLEIHQAINKVGTKPAPVSKPTKVSEEVSSPVVASSGEESLPTAEIDLPPSTSEEKLPEVEDHTTDSVSYQTEPISETSTYTAEEFIQETVEEFSEEEIEAEGEAREPEEEVPEAEVPEEKAEMEQAVEEEKPISFEEKLNKLKGNHQKEEELSPEDEYERFERELLAKYQQEQEEAAEALPEGIEEEIEEIIEPVVDESTTTLEEEPLDTLEADPQEEFDKQLEESTESGWEENQEEPLNWNLTEEEKLSVEEDFKAELTDKEEEDQKVMLEDEWSSTEDEINTFQEEESLQTEEKHSYSSVPSEVDVKKEVDELNPTQAEEVEEEMYSSEEDPSEEVLADEPLEDEFFSEEAVSEEEAYSEEEIDLTEEEAYSEEETDLTEESSDEVEELTSDPLIEDETLEEYHIPITVADSIEEEEQMVPEGFALERIEAGQQGTLGKLFLDGEFISYTLETTHEQALPEGEYELSLRNEGGKHATYYFKFKEEHKGMLWVKDVASHPYAMIHMGNKIEDSYGGILLGTSYSNGVENEEWTLENSEEAYLKIYDKLADRILDGQEVILHIHTSA
ncbi:MAG: DUF5675 family protein [Bacteroidota bacterium]